MSVVIDVLDEPVEVTEQAEQATVEVFNETSVVQGQGTGVNARISEVTLLASGWVGAASPYSQVVHIEGVTENSQVDLTPSVEQLVVFYEKDITFVTENEGGIVTVYVIGQKPQNDYTIQVTITEVDYV